MDHVCFEENWTEIFVEFWLVNLQGSRVDIDEVRYRKVGSRKHGAPGFGQDPITSRRLPLIGYRLLWPQLAKAST